MSRPEHVSAPEAFYDSKEASKYAGSSRMLAVQREITLRALELINLPQGRPALLLDVGCGSGLSGRVLAEQGHAWVGVDISDAMLSIAAENVRSKRSGAEAMSDDDEREVEEEDDQEEEEEEEEDDDDEDDDAMEEESNDDANEEAPRKRRLGRGPGDVALGDMGQGLCFRGNAFDGCVSVSAVQWLAYSHNKKDVPHKRLRRFFSSLYACLKRGARAAIQLYPETPEQMEMITKAAMESGFTGGVVVDYPNSAKAKKFYLVLFAGHASSSSSAAAMPAGKGESARHESTRERAGGKNRKRDRRGAPAAKSREWIQAKKDRQRRQGKDVRPDSKYTGRRRRPAF